MERKKIKKHTREVKQNGPREGKPNKGRIEDTTKRRDDNKKKRMATI